jgi:hypothetical protein
MSTPSKGVDPQMICRHGDDLERHCAENILNVVPSYASIWVTFIGNDGRQNYLPMPGAGPAADKERVRFWENLYTLFESLACCWELEVEFRNREQISGHAGYIWHINSWMVFYAHLGRIHDTAERVTEQIGAAQLFAPFDRFYDQRHIALHGIKVPMRWFENVLCAPPLEEQQHGWHLGKRWTELKETDLEFLSTRVSETLRELGPVLESFFAQVLGVARGRLGLRPVQWPNGSQIARTEGAIEVAVAGTQSCEPLPSSGTLYSGTLNLPFCSGIERPDNTDGCAGGGTHDSS